jgi:methionyl-tRNA formyltransferase
MGTPEFAVPSLDILIKNGYNIVGVITSVDKYGGRGMKKLIESPVKKYAVRHNIKVLQPKNLKSPEFVEELQSLKADLQIVVAFRMLPEIVWDMPPLGTYNLHSSLLPKYRGAAPINWAIIKGEKETGVTSFKLQHAIDTGDILFQEKISIGEDETAGELHDRLMVLGAEVVLKTANAIKQGNVKLYSQNDIEATKAPKIFTEDCQINWDDTSDNVYNLIKGLSPYPGAWTILDEKNFKILKARKEFGQEMTDAGNIFTDNKKYLKISTNDGLINILEVKMQGKKKMDIKSFLNGYKIESNKL